MSLTRTFCWSYKDEHTPADRNSVFGRDHFPPLNLSTVEGIKKIEMKFLPSFVGEEKYQHSIQNQILPRMD